jgi:putative ABC transport system permease protein
MTLYQLILQTLRHFWKQNLVLALGVALSTAVITGALMVGDSVSYSLERIVSLRLGKISHTLTAGDRFFTDSLAVRLGKEIKQPATSLLLLEGMVSSGGGQARLPRVQVLGIKDDFAAVCGSGQGLQSIPPGEAFISQNLAAQLNLKKQDEFILRVKKLSLIPLNAPFVSDAALIQPASVRVAGILDEAAMGRFHLKNTQTAPYNVFLSQDYLNELMETRGKANHVLLAAGEELETEALEKAFSQVWNLADLNLNLRRNALQPSWEISSDRVFIEPGIQEALQQSPYQEEAILTYFVNGLSHQGRETPYSFVSSLPASALPSGEVIINQWLARDLGAAPGDTLRLDYYAIGPLRKLTERSSQFVVKAVVPLQDQWADTSLMPHLPGLSDAGNCRDWETGVPVDLEKIRTKDESYWQQYQGIPKAFVSYSDAEALWQSRFGASTLIRFHAPGAKRTEIEKLVKERVDPRQLGFQFHAVKENAQVAANNGVDFGQLFLALSFFLVIAGILLTVLLFVLNTEHRMSQIGTLSILGFTKREVKKLLLGEGLMAAIAGAALGIVLAVGYNQAIFAALNGIWADIVRTQTLVTVVKPFTLGMGFLVGVMVSFLAILLYLNRLLQQRLQSLQVATVKSGNRAFRIGKELLMYLAGGSALALVIWAYSQDAFTDASLFFSAASLLLISLSLWAHKLFQERSKRPQSFRMNVPTFVGRQLKRNPSRSFLVVVLFALGTFVIISTGVHRRDLFAEALEKSSGTGGFLFFAESTVPVLQNLNEASVRFDYGLEQPYKVVQMRAYQGDDASCLNLNQTSSPRILGLDPESLAGRFRFVSQTADLDTERPWLSLHQEPIARTIPAIADQTVIQWGLGLSVGDTLHYLTENGQTLHLKLIGGLANSIFQGNVLISEENYLRYFPTSSGSNVFLVEGQAEDKGPIQEELQEGLRDHGWMMQESALRLAEFNSVENTYLSIFLVLGGLGLLIGTLSLGLVLVRNMLSRRNELGMMRALGFSDSLIVSIFVLEHFYLLLLGVGIGLVSSLLASLPSWTSPQAEVSPGILFALTGLLFLLGLLWIVALTRQFLRKESIIAFLRSE